MRRPRHLCMLAEITGGANEVCLGEILAAENEDDVVEPSLVDRLDGVLIELITQIDAADFRADVFR